MQTEYIYLVLVNYRKRLYLGRSYQAIKSISQTLLPTLILAGFYLAFLSPCRPLYRVPINILMNTKVSLACTIFHSIEM